MPEATPQIPWAPDVRVDAVGENLVGMQKGTINATLIDDGTLLIIHNSRQEAPNWMTKDKVLTDNIQSYFEHWQLPGIKFHHKRMAWLRNEPIRGKVPRSQKEFNPFGGVLLKHLGQWGSGNTYNFENQDLWDGDVFEFTDFTLTDGRKGAIIQWQERVGDPRGGDSYSAPEVWIGDFEKFMESQQSEDSGLEQFQKWNEYFENGLVWAADQLGLFNPGRKTPPDIALTLEDNPSLIWPALSRKMQSRKFDELSGTRRRRKTEYY